MDVFSLIIGGKAGEGINQAGILLSRLLANLGYCIYLYLDYPSLIRGGHNFAVIRASKDKVGVYVEAVDFVLALNQEAVDLHKKKLKYASHLIYDSDTVSRGIEDGKGKGVALTSLVKEENAPSIMRNTCIIGAFAKSVGIEWSLFERVFKKHVSKEIDLNLRLARRGYEEAKEIIKLERGKQPVVPSFTGNEAIALGFLKAGLNAYIAYPMTPASGILHFLAEKAEDFSIKVIHPENEIAVMLMATGFAYAGEKVAVGTSGGGFCLMTEGLSLTGIAELPVVVVVSQRPGPSTGVPTYTAQSDLNFVLNAGHGEFVRFIVSPGDAEEAYRWAQVALNISAKYQIPSIILVDKILSEGAYSFDINAIKEVPVSKQLLWDRKGPYKRYRYTDDGVSPLAFPADRNAIIKVNSYEHDESGITTENTAAISRMQDKRMHKLKGLTEEVESIDSVNVYGKEDSTTALIAWGSNKGTCIAAAENLDAKVIHPVVLSPFPIESFQKALVGVEKVFCIENNKTAQLAALLKNHRIKVDYTILQYDGRPFELQELIGFITKKQLYES